MEKKSRSGIEWLFLILAVVLIPLFAWVTYDSAADLADRLAGKGVSVQATITDYFHYTESDEGFERDRYKSYVSFDFEGKHYNHVLYSDSTSKPKLGKSVTVIVDPDNPEDLMLDGANYYLSMIMPPLFLAAILALVNGWLRDQLKKRKLKSDPEQDPALLHKQCNQTSLGILAAVLGLVSLEFYSSKQSLVYLCFSLVALGIVAFFTMRKPKQPAV